MSRSSMLPSPPLPALNLIAPIDIMSCTDRGYLVNRVTRAGGGFRSRLPTRRNSSIEKLSRLIFAGRARSYPMLE